MTARQGGCEDVIRKDITVHADSSTIPSAYLGALKIVSASVNPNPGSGIFQVAVVLSGAEPVVCKSVQLQRRTRGPEARRRAGPIR